MARVELVSVRKAFGSTVAVDDLDLAVDDGAFVSLLGPSGCGKTTVLRMLAGLEFPTRGTIRIGDRPVNDVPPGRRNVAMVFQSYALYPHLTVAGNIGYPLRKRGVGRAERESRVRAVAATLQLEALLDRKPRQLSGGQQQRVALGRALVREPDVFLLDEPLSNLDAQLRAHMRAELIQLHQRIGRTMVYVTHDQLEAMTMSDRIAVLSGGVLQQYATPAEIYHRPANRFVAGFLGTPAMNFLDADLTDRPEGRGLRIGGLELPAAWPPGAPGPAGGVPLTLGVRPEDVLVGDRGWDARVTVVEPTGHETILTVEVEGRTLVARAPAEHPWRAGEAVKVSLRTSRLHLFDRASGRRAG